jgi:NADH-quinone oxidoreductase subunit G
VKKHKVVDLGPTVVLDSERCILCSRCVRFTDEVSKTSELGIFNRGDRSEIGTVHGQPLNNNYSLNTVDICPVGALTSKDFRFRQRVWYLKDSDTICSGCSTGCNVKVYFNEEGLWRVKPRYNKEVNGYWMCDIGRNTYKFVNKKERLTTARIGHGDHWHEEDPVLAAQIAGEALRKAASSSGSVALVLTGQYTNEEYDALLNVFVREWKVKNVYHWVNNKEHLSDFDGILYRGDKNPNTAGLLAAMKKYSVGEPWENLGKKTYDYIVVAGPENQSVYPDLKEKVTSMSSAKNLIWLTACRNSELDRATTQTWQIPLKTYVEKAGTFVNYKGLAQAFPMATTIVPHALTLTEAAELLAGRAIDVSHRPPPLAGTKKNYFTAIRGAL